MAVLIDIRSILRQGALRGTGGSNSGYVLSALEGHSYLQLPHEIVTRVGVDLRFRLKGPFQPNLPHHLSFPQRPTPPIVFYISTSINEDQAPSWSQSPVFDPKTTPSHHMAGCMISSDA